MPASARSLRCEPLESRLTPAAGNPDPTFGSSGVSTFSLASPNPLSDTAVSVAALPGGGGILLGLLGTSYAVAKFTPAGGLDPTFGTGGQVVLPFTFTGSAGLVTPTGGPSTSALAVQSDGRILVAGATTYTGFDSGSTPTPFQVARVLSNGQPDPAFGTNGMVTVGFANGASASAVAVQPDGKIVLAGTTGPFPGTSNTDFAIARLNPDGSPDTSFATGGTTTVAFNLGTTNADSASAVVVLPDGRIVVGGTAVRSDLLTSRLPSIERDFAAARLLADGRPDPSFNGTGRATIGFVGGDDVASAAAVQPDGRVVLGGTTAPTAGFNGSVFGLARFNADGTPDATFGTLGRIALPRLAAIRGVNANEKLSAVAVVGGKIVAAGSVYAGVTEAEPPPADLGVVRVNSDGSFDGTFGIGGKVLLPGAGGVGTSLDRLNGLAVLPTGGLLVTGATQGPTADQPSQTSQLLVARLLGDPVNPGTVLAGGPANGSAVFLSPTNGTYAATTTIPLLPGFTGAVRTATADVTGDGVPDYIGGAGPSGAPRVVIVNGATGATLADFNAFESTFTGGVFVAAGDLDGDGKADVVVTPDEGGGPVVAVYRGAKLAAGMGGDAAQANRFLGIDDPNFRGGARPAVGQLGGSPTADLMIAAGFGGGPRVATYIGSTVATAPNTQVKRLADFFAFEPGLRNGTFVSIGDVNGDGKGDVVFGAGPGGGPRVRVIEGVALFAAAAAPGPGGFDPFAKQVSDFFAGDPSLRGGVRVALADAGGTGRAALVAGSGAGESQRVRVFRNGTLLAARGVVTPDQDLDPFGGGATLPGGVFVG